MKLKNRELKRKYITSDEKIKEALKILKRIYNESDKPPVYFQAWMKFEPRVRMIAGEIFFKGQT